MFKGKRLKLQTGLLQRLNFSDLGNLVVESVENSFWQFSQQLPTTGYVFQYILMSSDNSTNEASGNKYILELSGDPLQIQLKRNAAVLATVNLTDNIAGTKDDLLFEITREANGDFKVYLNGGEIIAITDATFSTSTYAMIVSVSQPFVYQSDRIGSFLLGTSTSYTVARPGVDSVAGFNVAHVNASESIRSKGASVILIKFEDFYANLRDPNSGNPLSTFPDPEDTLRNLDYAEIVDATQFLFMGNIEYNTMQTPVEENVTVFDMFRNKQVINQILSAEGTVFTFLTKEDRKNIRDESWTFIIANPNDLLRADSFDPNAVNLGGIFITELSLQCFEIYTNVRLNFPEGKEYDNASRTPFAVTKILDNEIDGAFDNVYLTS